MMYQPLFPGQNLYRKGEKAGGIMRKPEADHRVFLRGKIYRSQYSHLKLLLFWPLYGLAFWAVEKGIPLQAQRVIQCGADQWIPFREWFLIPYTFWYFYLAAMVVYTFLYDVEIFRKLMHYLIFTTAAALAAYVLFPNRQLLRPEVFPRENLLTRGIGILYQVDNPCNVCPSLHVMHAFAVSSAGSRAKGLQSRLWQWIFGICTGLICLSTVFIKQHSILDGLVGILICFAAEWLCYGGSPWENSSKKKTA